MTLADVFAVPSEMEFEGTRYKVRPPNQEEMGQFGRWLEQRAREFAVRSSDLPDGEQAKLLRGIAADAAGGVYDWGSDAYMQGLGTPLGAAKMLALIMTAENPDKEVSEEMAARMVASKVMEFNAILAAAETEDPKVRAAVLDSVGLPPNFLDSNTPSSPNSSTHPSTEPSLKSEA